MHDCASGGIDYSLESVDDGHLIRAVKENTDLADEDIAVLLEVSHTLSFVHELEGGDIFIDCLTRDAQAAVVIAQFCPVDETNYTRNIVGELMLRNNEPGVFRTLELGVPSRKLKAVVTGGFLIRQNVGAIRNKAGDIIGVLIVERNIQDSQLWDAVSENDTLNALKTAYDAKEIERVAEYMKDGMIRFNANGISVYANPSAKQIYRGIGYMDVVVGMPFENLAFGQIRFRDIRDHGNQSYTEVKIGEYILTVKYAPLNEGKEFMGAVLLIEDTTEEKSIEKELIFKSAAIDEIHHRVKNNLQTIISLMRLQSRRMDNTEARRYFSDTINRIFSISLTHEILAQKGVDDINIKEMLGRMLNSAKGYFAPEILDLSLEISGDDIPLKSDTATAIAMVVNELVQNCIKHAFVGRTEGFIKLEIKKGVFFSQISVHDNGVGFNLNTERPGSLGHKLVHSLVEDRLFGKIIFESSEEGTCATFDFMNDAEKQRMHVKGGEAALQFMQEEQMQKKEIGNRQ